MTALAQNPASPIGAARRLAGRLGTLGWSREDAPVLGAMPDCEWAALLAEVGIRATPLQCADAVDLLRADDAI